MNVLEEKKAFITGITGQDGSYLAELLLSKGYSVHGLVRRSSTYNTQRIDHIYHPSNPQNLHLHYGDLHDPSSISMLLRKLKPDEIYNLAAQSHVRVSFDVPEYTTDVNALGPVRILEVLREAGIPAKFYQASTSEMFGAAAVSPQNETTPFHPVSPYGISKLYAYWLTLAYRHGYGLFATNGILFNHETVVSFMPMFCKRKDEEEFDIKPISEIVSFDESKREYQARAVSDICVWGKSGWVDVRYASAYPHDVMGDNKWPRFINSRSGAFMATASHVAFMDGNREKETGRITIGDCLEVIGLPEQISNHHRITEEEAELLGMMVGDGSISYAKRGIGVHGKFTNSSPEIRECFSQLWSKVTGGITKYYPSRSGFNPTTIVGQLILVGGNNWLRMANIYNKDRTKRVPKIILNSEPPIMKSFLRGYNVTDGMKSNPCTYEFKNFKTNSATLAMGLWYLIDKTTKQDINLTIEIKENGRIFYSLNLLSTNDNSVKEMAVLELVDRSVSQRELSRMTGISRGFIHKIQHGGSACTNHHLRKNPSEVKKIIEIPDYNGWFYDLETSSGEFHCGIGKVHVHNSPRRGENFVTRKITTGIAKMMVGTEQRLTLGNLDTRRDWGYAPDYVRAMWMMLQQDEPDDYVIATGETHTVREFIEAAFTHAGIDLRWEGEGAGEKGIDANTGKTIVDIDPKYFRPLEVYHLRGEITKARQRLGWEPAVTFKELVRIMMDADLKQHGVTPLKKNVQPITRE